MKDNIKTIVANNIYHLRQQKRYGIERLCKRIHYSSSVYKSYEDGILEPTVKFLITIADYYGIDDIDWFFEDHGYERRKK